MLIHKRDQRKPTVHVLGDDGLSVLAMPEADACRALLAHAELVAACEEAASALASCYDVMEWPSKGKSKQDAALAVVRAALAKAKGDKP